MHPLRIEIRMQAGRHLQTVEVYAHHSGRFFQECEESEDEIITKNIMQQDLWLINRKNTQKAV